MSVDIQKSLGFNLGTTFFALGALLSKNLMANDINLTHHQAKMLILLGRFEGIKQQELAKIVQKDKPTITKMIDNLEKSDLVERRMDPEDRRNRLIYLTEGGKSIRKKVVPIVQKTLDEATSEISGEEFDNLIKSLTKLRENIQQKIEVEE